MKFQKLSFQCCCGQSANEIAELGLTRNHQLVVRWRCPGCDQEIFVVKSLSDCWRECDAESSDECSPEEQHPFISDAHFLRAMRVKFPDE